MLPYAWDSKANQSCKRSGVRLLISRIWMYFNIFSTIGILCLNSWSILFGGLNDSEKLLGCMSAIALTFLIGIYLGILVYEDELLSFMNACIRVNRVFGKLLNKCI